MTQQVLVVGLGEIGKPLLELIQDKFPATGVDLSPVTRDGSCKIMHVCFPFVEQKKFVEECTRYIRKYDPEVTIINSTVSPGTTRRIQEVSGHAVVNSPVRGKHVKMKHDLLYYTKFIGGTDTEACRNTEEHFIAIGMKTRILSSPEATELAKLSETTYFGLLIAWAQEVERFCIELGVDYDEVVSFYQEIDFFPPVKYFPGIIGGHCVIPNIAILQKAFKSALVDAIEKSNLDKIKRASSSGM